MDPVSLSILIAATLAAGISCSAAVLDDIAVIGGILTGIEKHTGQDHERTTKIENQALKQMTIEMVKNRLLIGVGLTAAFALGTTFAPLVMPLVSGALGLAAGGYFALKCVQEGHEKLDHFSGTMKARRPITRMVAGVVNRVRPNTIVMPPDVPKECFSASENCKFSDDEIAQDIVEEITTKDRGLTLELMLVAATAALGTASFSSLIAGSGILGGIAIMAAPMMLAGGATLVAVAGGSLLIAKVDNVGRTLEEDYNQKTLGQRVVQFGKVFTKVIGPVGILLLTGIAGGMFLEGLENLVPAVGEFIPHMTGLSEEAARIVMGAAIGTAIVGPMKLIDMVRTYVARRNNPEPFKAFADGLPMELMPTPREYVPEPALAQQQSKTTDLSLLDRAETEIAAAHARVSQRLFPKKSEPTPAPAKETEPSPLRPQEIPAKPHVAVEGEKP